MSKLGLKLAGVGVPGKTMSSRVGSEMLGAMPPAQLAPVLQLVSLPLPVQLKVAGARRVSRGSTAGRLPALRTVATRGRNMERNQRDQENGAIRLPAVGTIGGNESVPSH